MLTTIFGFASTISSIVGVIAFFTDSFPLLLICAGISLINSLIQVIFGDQNNLSTEISTVIISLIISFFVKAQWYIVISLGLCVVESAVCVLGWVTMLIMTRKK